MSVNGLVVMTPTSIASTGSGNSSSIGANGKVTFSSCATLSFNGVFTSAYDNYMVTWEGSNTTTDIPTVRLRASGTDASGSNYVTQDLSFTGTTVSGTRTASSTSGWFGYTSTSKYGLTAYFFGPFLAESTAIRLLSVNSRDSAYGQDDAVTHSLATSYDGFTILTNSGLTSGRATVFGFNQ